MMTIDVCEKNRASKSTLNNETKDSLRKSILWAPKTSRDGHRIRLEKEDFLKEFADWQLSNQICFFIMYFVLKFCMIIFILQLTIQKARFQSLQTDLIDYKASFLSHIKCCSNWVKSKNKKAWSTTCKNPEKTFRTGWSDLTQRTRNIKARSKINSAQW